MIETKSGLRENNLFSCPPEIYDAYFKLLKFAIVKCQIKKDVRPLKEVWKSTANSVVKFSLEWLTRERQTRHEGAMIAKKTKDISVFEWVDEV